MPTLSDHLFAFAFVVLLPLYGLLSYRRRTDRAVIGRTGGRARVYWQTIGWQWGVVGVAALLWFVHERPWAGLGISVPAGWRFWTALLIGLALLGMLFLHRRRVLRDPEEARRIRVQLSAHAALVPHSGLERAQFFMLAVTAGCCEELLWRGYLMWYVSSFAGLAVAAVVSAIVFGLAHLYQGRLAAVQITFCALLAAGLYVFSGSLWVPVLIHAAIDIDSGVLIRALFRMSSPADDAPGEDTPGHAADDTESRAGGDPPRDGAVGIPADDGLAGGSPGTTTPDGSPRSATPAAGD